MPAFAFLQEAALDTSLTRRKLEVLRRLGSPYSDAEIANAEADARAQMAKIVESLRAGGITLSDLEARSEAVALIAYVQRLGRDLASNGAPLASAQVGGAR